MHQSLILWSLITNSGLDKKGRGSMDPRPFSCLMCFACYGQTDSSKTKVPSSETLTITAHLIGSPCSLNLDEPVTPSNDLMAARPSRMALRILRGLESTMPAFLIPSSIRPMESQV